MKNILNFFILFCFCLIIVNCKSDNNAFTAAKSDYVDNNPIFPPYSYPQAGGASKEYLKSICKNSNADILISGISKSGKLESDRDSFTFQIANLTDDHLCWGPSLEPTNTICSSNFNFNSLTFIVEANLSKIDINLLLKNFEPNMEIIACGKDFSSSGNYSINQLSKSINSHDGFLAVNSKKYINQVKLEHFKHFLQLIYENSINSAHYNQFKTSCSLFKPWNFDTLSSQTVGILGCRELFKNYSSNYTRYITFDNNKYDNLTDKDYTLADIIEKTFLINPKYDPDFLVVSA